MFVVTWSEGVGEGEKTWGGGEGVKIIQLFKMQIIIHAQYKHAAFSKNRYSSLDPLAKKSLFCPA